jgi:hypothetical protein
MPIRIAALCSGRKILECELLARPDTDAGEPAADRLLVRGGRNGLQREVEELEEPGLDEVLVERGPGHVGRRRRRRLPEVGRQRLRLVALLTSMTFGMSAGSKSWVRKIANE